MTGVAVGRDGVPVLSGFPLRLSDVDTEMVTLEVRRSPAARAELVFSVDNQARPLVSMIVLDSVAVRTLVQALRHWLAGRMVDIPPMDDVKVDDVESLGGAS